MLYVSRFFYKFKYPIKGIFCACYVGNVYTWPMAVLFLCPMYNVAY